MLHLQCMQIFCGVCYSHACRRRNDPVWFLRVWMPCCHTSSCTRVQIHLEHFQVRFKTTCRLLFLFASVNHCAVHWALNLPRYLVYANGACVTCMVSEICALHRQIACTMHIVFTFISKLIWHVGQRSAILK